MSELAEADSMKNDISWKRFDTRLIARLAYETDRFSFDLSVPASYNIINGQGRALVEPVATARYRIASNLTVRALASQSYTYSGLYDTYGGYVMTNYRSILRVAEN